MKPRKTIALVAALLCIFAASTNGCKSHEKIDPPDNPAIPEPTLKKTGKPHIIFISIDTLRADHLGAYGYERDTSPNLDKLAGEGVLFEQVVSQSPKTGPSHMTMFTSLYPSVHGAHIEFVDGEPRAVPPNDGFKTLPELLKEGGYTTAAWTGGGQITAAGGFSRGFDYYFDAALVRANDRVMQVIFEFFKKISSRPSFLFIHTIEPHSPYIPPPEFDKFGKKDYSGHVIGDWKNLTAKAFADDSSERKAFFITTDEKMGGYYKIVTSRYSDEDVERLISLYDGEINYTDYLLGRFINNLKFEGLLENTVIVITSDHGEEFMEHGYFLHYKLYRETINVPLIIYAPGRLPGGVRVKSRVRLIDLAPTILELAGLPVPDHFSGESLLPLIGSESKDRVSYSEEPWLHETPHRSYRTENWSLYDRESDGVELFDMVNDPDEKTDLAEKRPDVVESLREEMEKFLRHYAVPPTSANPSKKLTPEEMERIKSLGYVE